MYSYNVMKLKCFFVRMISGSSILVFSLGIIIAILTEMKNAYDSASRNAYVMGLCISVLLVAWGIYCLYQAFHFEQFVQGKKKIDLAMLKENIDSDDTFSVGNLVVSETFVLFFSMNYFHMCTIIRYEDIIACFENPVYGTVETPTDYSIIVYDKDFKKYTIALSASEAERGHLAKEKICSLLPWIFTCEMDSFMDRIMTKTGRRGVVTELEKERYKYNMTTDAIQEADDELSKLESEAKEKLNFRSLLGSINKREDK